MLPACVAVFEVKYVLIIGKAQGRGSVTSQEVLVDNS